MSPTLQGGDYVVALSVSAYDAEGIYLLEDGAGQAVPHRAQWTPQGIRLSGDNPAYPDSEIVPRVWFDAHVLGFVVADLKVRDLGLLQAARAQ